jgi:hypothetical protein
MASLVSRMPLARCMALTLEPWRAARPERVSPFFTTTRVLRGLAATALDLVLGLVLVLATVDELFGFELVEAVLVRGFVLEEDVEGFRRETSTEREEVVVEIGVMLLGGLSLDASITGSASGEASCAKLRRVHFEGLSAQAST